ncbi:hypothetical protein BSLG_001007 [Batrachochytrium salamandrivorans]|nr:hypothetical protein BSLG_001007 [Batrachochytrium salamandrivorans]
MAPPAKRGKAAAPRDTLFNHQHTLTYGLKIVSKDAKTGKVDLVACRLCIAFGIEEKVGAKRQKTVCKKTFGPQFRPENYRSHLTTQHPKAWAAYQLKCDADKAVFFDVAVPFVNTIISHMDLERDHITYRLDKLIIEVIIEQMLWDPEDIDGLTFDNAMRIFTLDEPSGDYMVTIKTPMAYNLAVKHVGIGISMKQTALALQATKEEANVAKFGAMNQSKIATFTSTTRWHAMCSSTFWLTDHRHEVMDHYGAMPAGHPRRAIEPENAAFWILCSVTSTITSTIHSAVMRMQSHRLTLSQQQAIVKQLTVDLMLTIGVDKHFDEFHVVDEDQNVFLFETTSRSNTQTLQHLLRISATSR